jgi:hypothetical protein
MKYDFVFFRGKAFICVMFFVACTIGCTSPEEEAKNKQMFVDKCINHFVDECKSACRSDPEFTYCGTKYGLDVVGSGCVSEMRNIASSMNERKRKSEREQCYSICDPKDWDTHLHCLKLSEQ